ncbi:MAG: hypothetical protein QME64_06980 [bacterium]|nr:hypothetical protein [bacterium]
MGTAAQIEKFVRGIRRRNRCEIATGFIMLPVFGFFAASAPVGSLAFAGNLLILLAILFVIGMLWFVASVHGGLNMHPTNDIQYWKSEMLRQAKLLRRVPFWYIAPFIPGFVLLFWPAGRFPVVLLSIPITVVVAVFGFIGWLNFKAASELEQQANSLKEEQVNEDIKLTA